MRIRAYDFAFGKPTIGVKMTVKAGQRCSLGGAQVGKLLCTSKGNQLVLAAKLRYFREAPTHRALIMVWAVAPAVRLHEPPRVQLSEPLA